MLYSFFKQSLFTYIACSFAGMALLFSQASATAQDKQSFGPYKLALEPSLVDRLEQVRDAFDLVSSDYTLTRDSSTIWLSPKKNLSLTDLHYNLQYLPSNTWVKASLAQNLPHERKVFRDLLAQFNLVSRVPQEGTYIFQVDFSKANVTPFLDALHKRGISSTIPIVALGCDIGPLDSTLRSKNLVKIIESHMRRSAQKKDTPFILRTNNRSGPGRYLSDEKEDSLVFTVEEEKKYLGAK